MNDTAKKGRNGKRRPAIALAGRERSARLLRGLLAWAGSGSWQVLRLTPGTMAAREQVAVASPGDLSWELLERCVAGEINLAVLDLDDPISRYWQEAELTPCITYSENKDRADLVAKNLTVLSGGDLQFEAVAGGRVGRVWLNKRVCTLYEALNIMACGLAAGIPVDRSAAFFRALSARAEAGQNERPCYRL